MTKKPTENEGFASRVRNFIVEYLAVFFIVAANGTFLVLILVNVIDKDFNKSMIALIGALYLLFSCTISTILIYCVKGKVYYDKIKVICDVADVVAKGDLSARVPVEINKPKSEMDYLYVNFNKMLVEISSLENMRNDFVADVSHEIKTPLSVIQGYADLLQNRGLSDEIRREYTLKLSSAIESLTNLVTNILKLNRIENQGIVQREGYSLDEQIRCCVLGYEEQIEKKNLQVNVDLDEVYIENDKSLLEIVWNNLISNAIKYSDVNGEISVSLKREGENSIVTVSDNGCGMSEKTMERCFEKFYQGDLSHSQEGNGLGLALVKQVVSMLDANIRVESAIGKGTSFTVRL